MTLFYQGIILGFLIAAPVGPIGLLCIHRSLLYGFFVGVITGLGAASADFCYGLIALLGLTLIQNFLLSHSAFFHLLGSLFLIYLGVKFCYTSSSSHSVSLTSMQIFNYYTSTFFLTLTNPLTILAFITIFAGFHGEKDGSNPLASGLWVIGIFIGSLIWWILLSSVVSLFRSNLHQFPEKWINKIAGILLISFALFRLWND